MFTSRSLLIAVVLSVVLAGGAGFAAGKTYQGLPVVNVTLNGVPLVGDVPAVVLDGRTLLPVRLVAEAAGMQVMWDERNNTVHLLRLDAGIPQPMSSSDVIRSRIDGEFVGWDGDTIFVLRNGQIWQQVSYAYKYHYAYSPEVLIYRDGSVYKMRVDGVDDEITVKRVK